jgi:hypothetical protein
MHEEEEKVVFFFFFFVHLKMLMKEGYGLMGWLS